MNTGEVLINSQNHGFCIDDDLPDHVRVTHKSLFDGTIQGIELDNAPAYGFQGHPEASPGPHDVAPLFDHFIHLMQDGLVMPARDDLKSVLIIGAGL